MNMWLFRSCKIQCWLNSKKQKWGSTKSMYETRNISTALVRILLPTLTVWSQGMGPCTSLQTLRRVQIFPKPFLSSFSTVANSCLLPFLLIPTPRKLIQSNTNHPQAKRADLQRQIVKRREDFRTFLIFKHQC